MNTAWIFDVDGTVTNLEKEVVTEPQILDIIIKILKKDEPVAINTGRGINWVQETVLIPLENKAANRNILRNLFIVAESGGITAVFNQKGSLRIKINKSLKMPHDLDQKVRKLVQTKYSKTMRYESKKTMITTKIKEGTLVAEYSKGQLMLVKDLQKLIYISAKRDELMIDTSTIGTSVMHVTAGKDKGVELVLEWLLKNKIKPQKFITFGDSFSSDLPMAEKLHQKGKAVTFVYVGKENIDVSKYPFKIHLTEEKFEKGTLEYLQSL